MQKEGIKIVGYRGKWYVIAESYYRGEKVYLLEHETYGDETASIIVNSNLKVIKDNVFNGFEDLYN